MQDHTSSVNVKVGTLQQKGGALAVSWALDNACLFVLECPNLIVVTDINPFLRYAKTGNSILFPTPDCSL